MFWNKLGRRAFTFNIINVERFNLFGLIFLNKQGKLKEIKSALKQ